MDKARVKEDVPVRGRPAPIMVRGVFGVGCEGDWPMVLGGGVVLCCVVCV